jgi:hypothetical protein
MLRMLDKKAAAAGSKALRADLALRLHQRLDLGADDLVKLSEIDCAVPGCGDIETAVLIMRHGQKTQAVRIAKRLEALTDDDLADAVAQARRAWPAGNGS